MRRSSGAFWFGSVNLSIVVTALVLYGTLSDHIGELQDEIRRRRVDIRCLAEPGECDSARLLSEMRSGR